MGSSRRWEQSAVWSRQDTGTSHALCSVSLCQVAALDLDNVYMKYMLAVLALVMVGHLVVRRFFRP